MTLIAGFDVSHYNSTGQVALAVKTGAYVFVKATEGTSYVDPEHDADVAIIRAAHRTVGHYHFAVDVTKATAEAAWFVANAAVRPGDCAALDLEKMNGSWAERVAYAVAWLTYVEKATGAKTFRYMNKSWLASLEQAAPHALDRWPLWIATGGLPAGQPGVSSWVIHQYGTGGGMDHDVANHDLALYAVPHPVTPPPLPLPDMEDDMAKQIITEYDKPGPTPDAMVLANIDARTWTWVPDKADIPTLVAAGAVVGHLSPAFIASLTEVGVDPHA